jgi:hypothetical protein
MHGWLDGWMDGCVGGGGVFMWDGAHQGGVGGRLQAVPRGLLRRRQREFLHPLPPNQGPGPELIL